MKLRKSVLGAVAAVALAAIGTSAKAAEPWTGFYLGLQLGGASGDSDVTYFQREEPDLDSRTKSSGVVGGGQLGFNKQFGGLVVGAEVSVTNGPRGQQRILEQELSTQHVDINPVIQLVGRVGYAWGPTMLYGLGGYAGGNVDERLQGDASIQGDATFDKQWHNGWVVGAGVEHLLHPNVVVGLEYRHVSLGDKVHLGNNNFGGDVSSLNHRVDADYDVVTARISVKFGADRRDPMK